MDALAQWLPPGVPPAVVPVALVLVVVALLATLRSGRKKPVAPSPPRSSGAEKKGARKAGRIARKGDPVAAARMLEDSGNLEEAFNLYVEGEAFAEAADIAIRLGKKDRAASLFERTGQHEKAAELLEEIRQYGPAAKLYARAKRYAQAAALYERAGNFEKAVESYARDEDFRAAAELCVKRQDMEGAAKYYRKIARKIVTEIKGGGVAEKRLRVLTRVGADAVALLEKVGDSEIALTLAEAIGDSDATSRLALALGRAGESADSLIDAGNVDSAIELLEQAGETARANRLKAEQLEQAGELLEAATLYVEVGEFAMAADLFDNVSRPDLAADAMMRAGKLADAGQYFLKAKDGSQAASCFEQAGMFDRAAALYQRLGMEDKAIDMLVQGGKPYEAGLALAKRGAFDQALSLLSGIGREAENYLRSCVLRADIHLKRDEFDQACPLYETGLEAQEVGANSLQSFYRYGVLLQNKGAEGDAAGIFRQILKFDKDYRDVRKRYKSLTKGDDSKTDTKTEPGKANRYVILDELGRGGMGVVYKAMDRTLDRVVALKVLPDEVRENPAVVQNFFGEAKAAAALNHRNIVTVFDAGEEGDMHYIAMEYIEGRTLKQIVRDTGPFELTHWILVFGQVCKALQYANSQKIVHRDIKPSNLMWLEKEKTVKITDFGLAKIIQEVANFQTVVGGTPHYMSPEQILGEEVDQRADIYSLGATMFELATGSVPYPRGDAGYHHIHSPVPDATKVNQEFPLEMAGILMKCMDKEPAERYQSANEVLEALQQTRGS